MIATIGRIILAVLVASSCVAETIYQTRDAKGRPVFTDRPPPGAKPVELPPVNTTPGVTPKPEPASAQDEFSGYRKVGVVAPGSIPNGLAPVTVGIAIEPELRAGDRWQLLLDGRPVAEGREDAYTFDKLDRGTHQLALRVLDGGSAEVARSPVIEVFVFWPGKNR